MHLFFKDDKDTLYYFWQFWQICWFWRKFEKTEEATTCHPSFLYSVGCIQLHFQGWITNDAKRFLFRTKAWNAVTYNLQRNSLNAITDNGINRLMGSKLSRLTNPNYSFISCVWWSSFPYNWELLIGISLAVTQSDPI